jgi:putative endonuclease
MKSKNKDNWYIYILECSDESLYTGITNKLADRIKAHNEGNGAKYTRGRTPVKMVYCEICGTQSDALKREISIKKLSKKQKLTLIANFFSTIA